MSDISLLQLPLDVLVNILNKLSVTDLHNVMLTCKALAEVVKNDNFIWRSTSKDKLIVHNSTDNNQTNTYSWYNKCRISHNWRKGIYHSKIVLYHRVNYMPWLKFHNAEVLFLSIGSELYCYPTDRRGFPFCKEILWKLQVPVVKRFDVRTNDISRFVVRNRHIVCGNRDGCTAVYEMNNLNRKPRLVNHIRDCHRGGQVEVTAVELISAKCNPCVITASDATASMFFWHLGSYYEEDSPMTNIDLVKLDSNVGVRCLALNRSQEKLAVGLNGNSKPLMVDITTKTVSLYSEDTKSVKQAVRDIQWHNDHTMVYVTHSGALGLVDVRSAEEVYRALDPFQSTLYCVKSDGGNAVLAGSAEYSRCVLYDIRNCRGHTQMYFTQKKSSPIYCLDFDSTKLIAAADRSIAVLNFNVNVSKLETRDYSHAFEIVNR